MLFSRDSFSRIRNASHASTLWICRVSPLNTTPRGPLVGEPEKLGHPPSGNYASFVKYQHLLPECLLRRSVLQQSLQGHRISESDFL